MSSKETNIVREIMLEVSKLGSKIFRNNTGSAWIGESIRINKSGTVFVNPGDVVIRNARYFQAGLCVGSSDLIGLTPVEITSEMVGKKVAVFTAIEVKTETGKPSKEQLAFIEMVKNNGGMAGIATNPEQATKIIK